VTAAAHPDRTQRPTAAVVGSGVAGLTAAYLLQRTHDVTLFESDDRLGGHAHTHDVVADGDRVVPIDTGFIVHNERTYPNLLRLFGELGVATQPTEMSMSITCEGCGLEYAGARGLSGLFAQPRLAGNPAYLRMLGEVKRFHAHARRLIEHADTGASDDVDGLTLGTFLALGGYSRYFVRHFMIPVVSCVWSWEPGHRCSTPPSTCSGSWTTTGCSRSPGHRSGGRSPAAPARTWSGRPRASPVSRRAPPSDR